MALKLTLRFLKEAFAEKPMRRHHTKGVRPSPFPKLHSKYNAVAFSLYMSTVMAFLMCLLITAANGGLTNSYLSRVWHAYQVAMPCAFICVLAVRPLILRLVKWTVAEPDQCS